jgi:voltage-gated sodium channel
MIKKLFLNDKFIITLVLINAIIIFLSGFKFSNQVILILNVFDNLITTIFIIELITKWFYYGKRKYFDSNWRIFDFILVVISIPSLVAFLFDYNISNLSFLLILRTLRVFKSFRFIRFIPGINHIIQGLRRALKSSILILLAFTVYIFIIGTLSFFLFGQVSSEHFGNPLRSLFSIFKIFTIEGWYEIPDQISENLSNIKTFFTYLYFIFVVMSGGIFGLSLVNSIFVDAMVSDNIEIIEENIDKLDTKIDALLNKKTN